MTVSKVVVKLIPLEKLDEPAGEVRLETDPEEIASLAYNINEVGLLQPINVRPVKERFEIVAGFRRFKAFRVLGRKKIPCIVGDFSDVGSALARASENLRRVNLTLIEEAAIYADLHDNHNLRYDDIGKRMGISPGVVKRRLDLLKMPPQLQKAIHKKQISYGVAEDLWSLGDIGAIDYYLAFAIENGATRAVVRAWVKDHKDKKRRGESAGEEGRGLQSPMEPRPVWVTCDLCLGPMELGTEKVFRCCPGCVELIRKSLPAPGG